MSISKKRSRKAAPPVSLAVELGLAIREEREAEGLTLAQLAERSGFDVAELQLMEDGTRIPTQEEIAVLGKALNYHWLRLSHLAYVADQERHPRFVPI
ncbi:MAG: helix-turn-helix transcriptional regulator [Candidatus Angelobacter sp.]